MLEFIVDYRSPFTYLANTQLKRLGANIQYTPVDIVDVMRIVNNQPSPLCPAKSRYAAVDAARCAKHYGVPYSPNFALLEAMQTGQTDGSLLSKAALAAQELGEFDRVNDALFHAVWAGTDDLRTEQGRNIFLKTYGIAATGLWELASDNKIKGLLDKRGREAADRGVFGVPTMFVGNEMFFGNDRLDFIRERLQRHSSGAK